MALVVNTNVASIQAQYNVSKTNQSMQDAMAALSSGKRINTAGDDAAGLSISSRMESQIRGLSQAIRNAQDGISLVDTAEGAMDEITNMLQRMRELAIQSANGTNTDDDRANLDLEMSQLKAEIDRIATTTTFNNQRVLDGSFGSSFQIGHLGGETLTLDVRAMTTNSLGSVSGVAPTGSVTSASVQGKEGTPTVAQLSFSDSDTYEFKLSVETEDGTAVKTIKGVVGSGGAKDVVDQINAALRDSTNGTHKADSAKFVNVSYEGNTVRIQNNFGGLITVAEKAAGAAFSEDGGTIAFSTIKGSGTGDSNLTLGTKSSFRKTGFEAQKTDTVYDDGAVKAAVASEVKVQGQTGSDTPAATDKIKLALDDGAGNTVEVEATGDGTKKAAELLFDGFDALADKKGYTFAHAAGVLTITRADGVDFKLTSTATDVDTTANEAALEYVVGTAAAVALADGTESSAVGGGSVARTTAVDPSGGTAIYLDLSDTGTFTFKISTDSSVTTDDKSVSFEHTGTDTNRDVIATQVGTSLGSDFDVTHKDGRISIVHKAGNKNVELKDFTGTGAGVINASTEKATATGSLAVILDDATFATTATSTAAGKPEKTTMDVLFDSDDVYSFTISDGSATAIVNATGIGQKGSAGSAGTVKDHAEMIAEITRSLKEAGLDDLISVAAKDSSDTTKGLVLTHVGGKEISIDNFKSDAAGMASIIAGSYTVGADTFKSTGTPRFLDDGNGVVQNISGINVATASAASDAVSLIDAALENVNVERSKLGAVSNRLDFTVSNLGNVVTNTEASRSRIEDADFASESAKLAKNQILLQAGTAMLAQANASQQTVLSLLG